MECGFGLGPLTVVFCLAVMIFKEGNSGTGWIILTAHRQEDHLGKWSLRVFKRRFCFGLRLEKSLDSRYLSRCNSKKMVTH